MERFGGVSEGAELGPIQVSVSAEANERYWQAAGVDHPALRAGTLYPPIVANLTILLFQTVAPRPLLHTAQRIVSHRAADAGAALTVTGTVAARYRKRGREYADVEATVVLPDGAALWTSRATFTEVER